MCEEGRNDVWNRLVKDLEADKLTMWMGVQGRKSYSDDGHPEHPKLKSNKNNV